jgi:hypothetical protein
VWKPDSDLAGVHLPSHCDVLATHSQELILKRDSVKDTQTRFDNRGGSCPLGTWSARPLRFAQNRIKEGRTSKRELFNRKSTEAAVRSEKSWNFGSRSKAVAGNKRDRVNVTRDGDVESETESVYYPLCRREFHASFVCAPLAILNHHLVFRIPL